MLHLAPVINKGNQLLHQDDPHNAHRDFQLWVDEVATLFSQHFPESGMAAEWIGLPYSNIVCGGRWMKDEGAWIPFRKAVTDRIDWIGKVQKAEETRKATDAKPSDAPITSRKIFVVHGRDQTYRDTTARLLEKLRLEPIILHEQPNKGRTIIEKFTDYAGVGFAVTLLTGDDRGGLSEADPSDYRLRARQNVILELGYFLGRLGRDRVCALYQGEIEIPSDYDGVVWIALDDGGGWKYKLAKEIQAAGIAVDLNDVV